MKIRLLCALAFRAALSTLSHWERAGRGSQVLHGLATLTRRFGPGCKALDPISNI